jgi:hypothetical protein
MKNVCYVVIGVLMVTISSCAGRIYKIAYPTLADGKYDSEFPYKDCSKELGSMSQSVKMIYCTAYYRTFIFSAEKKIRLSDLTTDLIKTKSDKTVYSTNSVSGTATLIYHQNKKIALLTCAHIIDYSDTVFTYYKLNNEKFIQSVSFKERQTNFVSDVPEAGEFEVLAREDHTDIAVLGKEVSDVTSLALPVFSYPFGRSKELDWGTFIYLIGFPSGQKMVTKGIVSSPNKDKSGSFLTDAPFNHGFSGGIVLAIRDGVPNFELVGIANSVASQSDYFLVPAKDLEESEFAPDLPYQGDIYVRLKTDIKYGVTHVISSESIVDFFKNNEKKLMDKGYDFRTFFNHAAKP